LPALPLQCINSPLTPSGTGSKPLASIGSIHKVFNDTSDYVGLSLSADGRKVLAVQAEALSNLWTTDFSGENPTQITIGKSDGFSGVTWTPDDKLVFTSYVPGGAVLCEVDPDGANRRQLTSTDYVAWYPAVSRDGRYVVFLSDRDGRAKLWHIDRDGNNLAPIRGTEHAMQHVFSEDGHWLIFSTRMGDAFALVKAPVSGGEPVQLTRSYGNVPRISPDGKRLLYHGVDIERRQPQFVIIPADGGPQLQRLDIPASADQGSFTWTPDGKAVLYVNRLEGESRLWRLPLDGKPAAPFNSFTAPMINGFDWSSSSHKLVYACGTNYTSLALITPEP